MAEMLLQSHSDHIELLPALPSFWKEGEISGLKARGNFEISMQWSNHKLKQVSIKSLDNQACVVKYADKSVSLKMKKNQILTLNGNLKKLK